jgi:hypothetical protein
MIEPAAFGFNAETAENNFFQQKANINSIQIQDQALTEFNHLIENLRANDIRVIVVKDTLYPHTPDAIFPNNWISFHSGGQAVLFPMFAKNRRMERRNEILEYLNAQGCSIKNVDDFTFWEEQNRFLEGTGSMVLDRVNRVAYAALSPRTDQTVFLEFCKLFEFKPVYFIANQMIGDERHPVYHTNVMLSIANEYAIICSECIDDKNNREKVLQNLKQSGKEIIEISELQMNQFAGNMLQVENKAGKQFLVMSQSAHDSLNLTQLRKLKAYNDFIVTAIPTIEQVGGGSVRCMLAEIF